MNIKQILATLAACGAIGVLVAAQTTGEKKVTMQDLPPAVQ